MKELYVVVGICKDTSPFVWGDDEKGNFQIMNKEEAEKICEYQRNYFPDIIYRPAKLSFLD